MSPATVGIGGAQILRGEKEPLGNARAQQRRRADQRSEAGPGRAQSLSRRQPVEPQSIRALLHAPSPMPSNLQAFVGEAYHMVSELPVDEDDGRGEPPRLAHPRISRAA